MPVRNSPLYLPILSILVAVELVLAFSAFGYIVIPPISLTFMPLPVLAGALLFGPVEGLFLGGIFGLTSMWKASVTATAYADQIFSPFISGAPLSSLMLSVGTRMLFGLIAGWFFHYAKQGKRHKQIQIILAAICADFLHSLLVVAGIQVLFPDAGITITYGLSRMFSLNNLIDWTLIGLLMSGLHIISGSREARIIENEIRRTEGIRAHPRVLWGMTGLIILMFFLMLGLWYHFYNRTEILLQHEGIVMSQSVLNQFWQLGAQFLVAVVSLFLLVSVVLVLTERYLMELAQQAKRDMMTGLYNKATLEQYVDAALNGNGSRGFLLILDVDDFKRLNDTYGHPAGDKVLIAIASILQKHFENGVVGRLGGDEFCVYADNISETEMLETAGDICGDVAMLSVRGAHDVSCSIGVAFCNGKRSFSEGYATADQALYRSKRLGKNRYSLEGKDVSGTSPEAVHAASQKTA